MTHNCPIFHLQYNFSGCWVEGCIYVCGLWGSDGCAETIPLLCRKWGHSCLELSTVVLGKLLHECYWNVLAFCGGETNRVRGQHWRQITTKERNTDESAVQDAKKHQMWSSESRGFIRGNFYMQSAILQKSSPLSTSLLPRTWLEAATMGFIKFTTWKRLNK